MKFVAESAQGILGIELNCEIFVSGEGHKSSGNVQRSTLNAHRSIQAQRCSPRLSTISSRLSTVLMLRLHKLNGRTIGITNVNDAFAGVRARLKSLGFTGSFPTRRVDGAQNRVEIIDNKGDMYEADVAWLQTDM